MQQFRLLKTVSQHRFQRRKVRFRHRAAAQLRLIIARARLPQESLVRSTVLVRARCVTKHQQPGGAFLSPVRQHWERRPFNLMFRARQGDTQ